jgi:hypothetical protein
MSHDPHLRFSDDITRGRHRGDAESVRAYETLPESSRCTRGAQSSATVPAQRTRMDIKQPELVVSVPSDH